MFFRTQCISCFYPLDDADDASSNAQKLDLIITRSAGRREGLRYSSKS